MIRQWKGKQRVTPGAWTGPYFIIPLLSTYLFCSFPYPSPSHSSSFLFSYFEKKEGREREGERIDKEECHLLCALFCLSHFSIHLSSILFFALPINNAILLSLLSPSLSLLFSYSPLNDKSARKEEQEGNGGHAPFFSNGWGKRAGLAPCP